MATNLALDDALIRQAQDLGGHKTKKDAVTAALEWYVRSREIEKLIALAGTIEWDDDYDILEERRRERARMAADADC